MSESTTSLITPPYTGKKKPGTFTVTVFGSANDGIEEKYKKEAFLVGYQIAQADKWAREHGMNVEFCNGGTGHGCMKWSAVGYLIGGGSKIYGISTEEICKQEESSIVADYVAHIKNTPGRTKELHKPTCIVSDLDKIIPRSDIELILKWEREDNRQYLPDSIYMDLLIEEKSVKSVSADQVLRMSKYFEEKDLIPSSPKEFWNIGKYDLVIWPEIQVRMLEMIHRANELVLLAGGMGTKQETNRAIMDIVFNGTLTQGMSLSFGGMGHWDAFTDYLREEYPTLYKKHLHGKGDKGRLNTFASTEEFGYLLGQSLQEKDFSADKPSFPEYIASRHNTEIALRLTTGPDSTQQVCFYTGLFHNQDYDDDAAGIRTIQERGYRVLKLPKLRMKPDFPNEFALYVKEALAHVTDKQGLVIVSLDPIGSDLERVEVRRLLQDYVHDSAFVGQQVNEPKGFQKVPVYVVLPPEKELEGYFDHHDIAGILRNVAMPAHTKLGLTVIEDLMRRYAFIRQAEGVVYQPVKSVQQALELHEARMAGTNHDPRVPDSLRILRKNSQSKPKQL